MAIETDILQTATEAGIKKRQRVVNKAINLGLYFNVVLAIAKTVAGIVGHSQALLADGINSMSDVAYFIVVKIFVRLSEKPADKEHPYGHHQFESIAALAVGAFVVTTAIAILWDSINNAFELITLQASAAPLQAFTFWVAISTIIIKIGLVLYSSKVGKRTKNIAVAALARDHRNDIFSSVGAAVGIALGLMGFRWVDPVAGAVVALIVLKTGIEILRESSSDLMDTLPCETIANQVRETLVNVTDIDSIEEIHAHRFGPYLVINLTIGIDGNLTVTDGDRIATGVENILRDKMEMVRKVYVHYHPSNVIPPLEFAFHDSFKLK